MNIFKVKLDKFLNKPFKKSLYEEDIIRTLKLSIVSIAMLILGFMFWIIIGK